MITYDLCCERGHIFEGWFKDTSTYDKQAKRKLVACAVCGSTKVRKLPMAPAVAGTRSQNQEAPLRSKKGYANHPDAPKVAELMKELTKLREHIEANAEHVGPRFAEEARRIHYGETEKKSIYGEATENEARALNDEGIEVARIPWVRRADS
jgi:hypothetical protein